MQRNKLTKQEDLDTRKSSSIIGKKNRFVFFFAFTFLVKFMKHIYVSKDIFQFIFVCHSLKEVKEELCSAIGGGHQI